VQIQNNQTQDEKKRISIIKITGRVFDADDIFMKEKKRSDIVFVPGS
jgi:hypothetical protein